MNYKLIQRYSRFVVASKKLCILIVILLMAIIAIFPLMNRSQNKLNFEPIKSEIPAEPEKAQLIKPNFFSVSTSEELYNFIAEKAIEKDKNQVWLERPYAQIMLSNKIPFNLQAEEGIWQQHNKQLNLIGAVIADYYNYNAKSSNIKIEVNANIISSLEKLTIENDELKLYACGFEYKLDKKIVEFSGPVKFVLFKKPKKLEKNV